MKNIIIGAGPAGIQMAHLLGGLILEKSDSPCSFFKDFPRQKRLISVNRGSHLRYDWNSFLDSGISFQNYSDELYPSTDDYLRYVNDFVTHHNIQIQYNYTVTSIEKLANGQFLINNEYTADRVFFGTGIVPREPAFDCHDSKTVFTYANMPLDKSVYRGKSVVIIGSGNAGFETADWLGNAPDKILIFGRNQNAWSTHYPGHLRSINMKSIDAYHLKMRTGLMYTDGVDSDFTNHIKKILTDETHKIFGTIDIVIFCTGFTFDPTLVQNLVDISEKNGFPVLTPHYESTKCPGLFFIGASSQNEDYKVGTSGFIHGYRYNCQYIQRRLTGAIVPETLTREKLTDTVFTQLNSSSSLFHRFDFFCDLVGVAGDGTYKYIKEIPMSAVLDYTDPAWKTFFTLRLGYNRDLTINHNFHRQPSTHPADAEQAHFIHPIIECQGQVLHLPENIMNEFIYTGFHIKPFTYFLKFADGINSWAWVKKMISEIEGGGDRLEKYLQ